MLLLRRCLAIPSGLLLTFFCINLHAQTFEWGIPTQGKYLGPIRQTPGGNLIVAGSLSGMIDADPGPSTNYITSAGQFDFYLMQLTPEGAFSWAKPFGGTRNDWVQDLSIDRHGNIYLTGTFLDVVDFDPGPNKYELNAGILHADVFILKLDSAGNFIWAHNLGNPSGDETVTSIRVDTAGNVYTTGAFFWKTDFDPGPDSLFLQSNNNVDDVFIQKLDTDGNFLWAKRFGSLYRDKVTGMEMDAAGHIILSGSYSTAISLQDNLTIDTTLTGNPLSDIFLLQLNADGSIYRVQSFGGTGLEDAGPVAVDATNGIVMAASFSKTADFDPGPDSLLLTSDNFQTGVIFRLDAAGNLKWAKPYGSTTFPNSNGVTIYSDPNVQDILVDSNDQIFISGNYEGAGDFDPGPAVYNLASVNNSFDIFIEKLTPDGNLLWAQSMGDIYFESGCTMDMDSAGNLLLTGEFDPPGIDIDPGPGVAMMPATGCFIAKWQQGFDFYGRVFRDTNANQVFDPGEKTLQGVVLAVPGAGRYANTNSFGQYHIDADLYGDTLMPVPKRPYWTVHPTYRVADSTQLEMDFAVEYPDSAQDLSIYALEQERFSLGRLTKFLVNVSNAGNVPTDTGRVSLVFDTGGGSWLTTFYVDPLPEFVSDDSLSWRIGPIKPDSSKTFILSLRTDPSAPIGHTIAWVAEAHLSTDVYLQDNVYTDSSHVVGAYDPNDKRVSPGHANLEALDTTWLRYCIRFQNVGNAPAEQVVIRDTLPASLRIESLHVLGASHPMEWKLSEYGLMTFDFPGINLPDSIHNEAESHGFVLFEMLPGSDLTPGDSVLNRAGIYFDLNDPVITPYAVFRVATDNDGDGFDQFVDCDDNDPAINPGAADVPGNGIDENCDGQDAVTGLDDVSPVAATISPNPARDQAEVVFNRPVSGLLELFSASGVRVTTMAVSNRSFVRLALQGLAPGVYALCLRENGVTVSLGKLVLR